VDELAERVSAGEALEPAARAAGTSPRSLRRWRRAGREQLQALPLEGRLERRLEFALQRAQVADPEDWETIASRLVQNEVDWAEFGTPVGFDF
jgi:transposase-like protein